VYQHLDSYRGLYKRRMLGEKAEKAEKAEKQKKE
jgi:hypothetical protein